MNALLTQTVSLLILLWASIGFGGELISYEVVVLDADGQLILVDMSSGSETAIPLPAERPERALVMAAEQRGLVSITGDGSSLLWSEMLEWNRDTGEWAASRISPLEFPEDMKIHNSGDYIIGDEFGVIRADRDTGEGTGLLKTGELDSPKTIATDSTGDIITNTRGGLEYPTRLHRLRGDVEVETIDVDILLGDFTLESDESLLAIERDTEALPISRIHRVSLKTGESELLHQSDIPLTNINVDLEGRVLVLGHPTWPEQGLDQVLRLDLDTGATESFPLSISNATDLDILVIPEPSALGLLALGCLGALGYGRRRQHWPAAGCRRRSSGIAA